MEFSHEKDWFVCSTITFQLIVISDRGEGHCTFSVVSIRCAATICFIYHPCSRTLSLIIAGSTMSISGLIMQQLTQNKFVAPSVAGTTDSARLGILVAMLFFPTAPFLYRTAIAFIFALSGTLLFLALIRLLPSKNQVMVPLVGVMFGNILGSIATFLPINTNWFKICLLGYKEIFHSYEREL